MSKNESCCIAKILKVIDILQKRSQDDNCNFSGCTKPILGPSINTICYNTRPITLYNKDNSLFTVTNQTTGTESSIFRVEDVEGCCAKLRVLTFNATDSTYTKTNQFVTVNLKCICAVRCLDDAAIDC